MKTKRNFHSWLTVNFRRAGLLECLYDEPEFEQYPLGDDLIGVVYDGAQQCLMVDRGKRNYVGWCPVQTNDLGEAFNEVVSSYVI